jgi:hypothetical protein
MKGMASESAAKAETLRHRLAASAARWPAITELTVRYRAGYAYVNAVLDDSDDLQLCRLTETGHPQRWGFALYTYSGNRYEDSILPTGEPTGTPEEAFDCAARLYLGDPPNGSDPRNINAVLH